MATTALEAAGLRASAMPHLFSAEHGSQIFVYTHLRTRQTIYSLAKSMTKDSLKQLTFVGKKSVPSTLRKDMWTPLCVLSFPNPYQGLHAFARLREFRERHETEWPLEDFTVTKGPNLGNLLSRRERSFKLMDQKANSIADMAAVLAIQARPPESWLVKKMARLVDTKEWYIEQGSGEPDKRVVQPLWPRAKRGPNSKIGHRVFEFQGKIGGTSIWWANINDAEYAETWPSEVVHHNLHVARGHPCWPPGSRLEPETTNEPEQQELDPSLQTTAVDAETPSSSETKRTAANSDRKNEAERIKLLKEKIKDARKRMVDVPHVNPRLSRLRSIKKD